MSTYDLAHRLAKEIKNSQEYQEYQEHRKKILADEKTKNMLLDYQKQQMQLQSKQFSGQDLTDEEKEKFKNVQNLVEMNTKIKNYLEAEQRISIMVNDLQKILFGDLEFGVFEDEE